MDTALAGGGSEYLTIFIVTVMVLVGSASEHITISIATVPALFGRGLEHCEIYFNCYGICRKCVGAHYNIYCNRTCTFWKGIWSITIFIVRSHLRCDISHRGYCSSGKGF